MATQLVRTNQVRNTTIGVGLMEVAALAFVWPLLPMFSAGMLWMALVAGVCVWGWRYFAPELANEEPTAPERDHVAQLERWCERLELDMPEILRHEYTDTGEQYWLKVTGDYTNDMGQRGVLTPEMFYEFRFKFRAVAGDNCRGVFISPPDKRHGGRCAMTVVWDEKQQDDSPWPIPVLLTASSIRMCYSHEEVAAAHAEAERNGFTDPTPAWPAPNPAEMVGEG